MSVDFIARKNAFLNPYDKELKTHNFFQEK